MRKIHIVIAVILGIILMMFFAHTPLDEIKKRREAMAGKRLVQHIMDRNGKDLKSDGETGIRAGGDTSDDRSPYDAPRGGGMPSGGLYNPFVSPPPTQFQPQGRPVGQPPAQRPATVGGPQDDYYPPTPNSQLPGGKPQSSIQNLFYPQKSVTLANGNTALFEGPKVYSVGANGVVQPLKDGQYPIFGGSVIMTIRGGEKTIIN